MPAIATPIEIAKNAFLVFISKSVAAAVPVQAPVTGKGMDTKQTNPQNPHFSIILERLCTLANHHLKKPPINFIYCNLWKKYFKNKSNGITGKRLPKTESRKTLVKCILSLIIPTGIAALNSSMGRAAINIVATSLENKAARETIILLFIAIFAN